MARDFFPRVNFQCRLSYNALAALVCNRMHQHLCTHSKSQTLLAIPLFGHTRILHMLVGMGSAALTADVPSHNGQWSTKKKKNVDYLPYKLQRVLKSWTSSVAKECPCRYLGRIKILQCCNCSHPVKLPNVLQLSEQQMYIVYLLWFWNRHIPCIKKINMVH